MLHYELKTGEADPKSIILALPCLSKTMFAGFKSLCTIFNLDKNKIPYATSVKNFRILHTVFNYDFIVLAENITFVQQSPGYFLENIYLMFYLLLYS